MTILHSKTDPTMLARLKEMLASSSRVDIAVGYFFVSGFAEVADEISKLSKTRILVGRPNRPTLEAVAAGLHQARPMHAQLEVDQSIRRSQREPLARNAVADVSRDIGALPQTDESQSAVEQLRQLVSAGFLEMRTYPREFLHAKAYLCWYEGHAEPGAAIVGYSNFTLAGFQGNTELNVRVPGDQEMGALKDWFDALWQDSVDITDQVALVLDECWAIKQYPPYLVYLKALYELLGRQLDAPRNCPWNPSATRTWPTSRLMPSVAAWT
jgi:phosphatidylserine/phosphatidylglycerophosphate/cardiolipin synthase-like enzyme